PDKANREKIVQTDFIQELNVLKATQEYLNYQQALKDANDQIKAGEDWMRTAQGSIALTAKRLKDEGERKLAQVNETYKTLITNLNGLQRNIDQSGANISFYEQNLKGQQHASVNIKSIDGNINLVSAKGLSLSGSKVNAQQGEVRIEAAGTLTNNIYNIQGQYDSATENSVKQGAIASSIIIDANQDSYEFGNETDTTYAWRSPVDAPSIYGKKGVKIKATGTNTTDNLVLQGVDIRSEGDVNIEAHKNIIFDVAVESGYDKSTTTETKKKWYGKKTTTTTVNTSNKSEGVSVNINAKNINIKSKEQNTKEMTGKNRTSIDMYSSQFTATGGKISIQAGGDLNFLTALDVEQNTDDITKKSSFLGVKLNKSKTTATRNIKAELPATLKADYIGTKSGLDTRLKGPEFEYLSGATIEAGGVISLESASNIVEQTLKRDKNSVVWQSMQDKGSITETAQLPSFNGPVLPTFKAAGGLSVQVPISEKDVNKVELRDEILKLANQPGNAYLKELVNRKDVDWQKVLLAQKDWDYKSQGLTAAGAALIVIIVTIATMGSGTAAAAGAAGGTAASGTTVGLGASMIGSAGVTTATVGGVTTITGVSTLGAMANAAITSLATQASVGLINNGGDIGKTLKDLGSKDSVKNLAASVVTAGLLNGVATNLNISSNAIVNDIANNMATGMIQGVGSTLIDSAVNGRDLSEGLEKALLAGLANSLQAPLAGAIGDTLGMSSNAFVSKVVAIAAHAAAGCATGVVDNECKSRALGAALGEVIAENMFKPANGIEYTEAEKSKILNITKLTTGVVAAYAGYNVTAAANAADIAVSNNYLNHVQEKQKSQELKDCNVLTCGGVVVKWAAISAGQDANYAAGFAVGIPTSVAESVVGLAKMALSPIQTYKAIKEVINSENALGNISDAIKQDYTNRINKLESEYEKAGIKGSYNAGLEAGKLTADVASLFAGGASIAKGGVILTEKVAAKVGYKVLKDPIIISDKGIPVTLDGHKIYDPQFTPLSTNPGATYRFSDPTHRKTGGDVYFGENIATSYFEVRQAVNGKSLFVGQVEVKNMLDLTDPKILKQMGIDQKKLTQIVNTSTEQDFVYAYTNKIANQAYDKGYSGIIYNSSRNTGSSNNRAVILFGGRYDAEKIKPVLDKPILKK
ncbi:DUF637 domain-containing protein, partial [Acinetobacter baumannii]|nr:DUF637 domain-containing protein [Acinetobacter baumannii]